MIIGYSDPSISSPVPNYLKLMFSTIMTEWNVFNMQMYTSNIGISKCSFMEVLVVQAREHLNLTDLDGDTALHFAAHRGHSQVCSLLAAQVYANAEIHV